MYLSLQVDHLTRKPKDGERSLREILSILHENDISPFEVTQSGLDPALLTFLTKKARTRILGEPNAYCLEIQWAKIQIFVVLGACESQSTSLEAG